MAVVDLEGSSRDSSAAAEPPPAGILAPAPILGLAAFGVGLGLELVWPLESFPRPLNLAAGGGLVVVGVAVLAGALWAMRAAGKTPAHSDEPRQLVTDGPFRYTRNPLYLGIVVIYLGLTAFVNTLWPLLPLVPLAWYLDRVARREEAYLEGRFGEEFAAYRGSTRRWL